MTKRYTFVAQVLAFPTSCSMPWCDGLLKDFWPMERPRNARCSSCGLQYRIAVEEALAEIEPPSPPVLWWAFLPWNINRPQAMWTPTDPAWRGQFGNAITAEHAEYVAILAAKAAAAAGVEPPR